MFFFLPLFFFLSFFLHVGCTNNRWLWRRPVEGRLIQIQGHSLPLFHQKNCKCERKLLPLPMHSSLTPHLQHLLCLPAVINSVFCCQNIFMHFALWSMKVSPKKGQRWLCSFELLHIMNLHAYSKWIIPCEIFFMLYVLLRILFMFIHEITMSCILTIPIYSINSVPVERAVTNQWYLKADAHINVNMKIFLFM